MWTQIEYLNSRLICNLPTQVPMLEPMRWLSRLSVLATKPEGSELLPMAHEAEGRKPIPVVHQSLSCCCDKTLGPGQLIEEFLLGLQFQRVTVHNRVGIAGGR